MKHNAFRFVLLMSFVSLFADMTYEGGRSITGPFLAHLGASGALVGFVGGFGELLGYGIRAISGRFADRTGKHWIAAYVGYAINVLTIPLLAVASTLPPAVGLIIGERLGRGIRRPSSSALVAHAGSVLGTGWVFGFREALDQTGATLGPLTVAAVLYLHGGFTHAFAILAVPAALTLVVLATAWRQYPSPQNLEAGAPLDAQGFGRGYWLYAAGGACIAAGFADFALISYHFAKAGVFAIDLVPVVYAGAMVTGAVAAPMLGRWYDRAGITVAIVAFGAAAFAGPLVFFGSFWPAVLGVGLWGLGLSAQDALLTSIVAQLAPPGRRATALGVFDTIFGAGWFAGSAIMGLLYDVSLPAVVAFSVVLQLAGLPLLARARNASSVGATSANER